MVFETRHRLLSCAPSCEARGSLVVSDNRPYGGREVPRTGFAACRPSLVAGALLRAAYPEERHPPDEFSPVGDDSPTESRPSSVPRFTLVSRSPPCRQAPSVVEKAQASVSLYSWRATAASPRSASKSDACAGGKRAWKGALASPGSSCHWLRGRRNQTSLCCRMPTVVLKDASRLGHVNVTHTRLDPSRSWLARPLLPAEGSSEVRTYDSDSSLGRQICRGGILVALG